MLAWERYERERDTLCRKLNTPDIELPNTIRVYSLVQDTAERKKTATEIQNNLVGLFNPMKAAHNNLHLLLDNYKKSELEEEKVRNSYIFDRTIY